MNKIKEKLFSLPKAKLIPILVAGVLVAGVAIAGLVNYLSDYVSTTANVTSPIEMSVNEGRDGTPSGTKSINIDTTGGSYFTFTTVAKNNANNEIKGYPVIVAVAPAGQNFTGGEIEEVLFDDGTGDGPVNEKNIVSGWNITEYLYVVYSDGSLHKLSEWTGNSKRLVLFFDNDGNGMAQPYPIAAGEVKWNVLTITPNEAIAPGTYGIYAQYASDLAEYATYQYGL